jgi:hypothetical protein
LSRDGKNIKWVKSAKSMMVIWLIAKWVWMISQVSWMSMPVMITK